MCAAKHYGSARLCGSALDLTLGLDHSTISLIAIAYKAEI